MTPDTLDAASELTQQRIEMAVAAHRLTTQQYQQRTVRNAGIYSVTSAGKRIRDARCASVVLASKNYGISNEVGDGRVLHL